MVDCKINLLIHKYDSKTKKLISQDWDIGKQSENKEVTVKDIAQLISKLSKEDRETLAAQLRAARVQPLTSKMIKERQFISNTTLEDLQTIYPELANYEINGNIFKSITIIHCTNLSFNGTTYKGRVQGPNGQEIFIINNKYDADKLFKYLLIKQTLPEYVSGELHEDLKEYKEDLNTLVTYYKAKSIQALIEDFLINKQKYKSTIIGDKRYNPINIISQVLSKITKETINTVKYKSNLQSDLELIKESGSDSLTWKFNKNKLYTILKDHFPQEMEKYSKENFKDLSTEYLNKLLQSLFKNDVNLIRARVINSTNAEPITKQPKQEFKEKFLRVDDIQKIYVEKIKNDLEKAPSKYQNIKDKQEFVKLFNNTKSTINDNGVEYLLEAKLVDGKIKVVYNAKAEAIIQNPPSYVTINLGRFNTLGEIYNFGYVNTPLFRPITQYKGFYIYQNNNNNHYSISRHVLSPYTQAPTFQSIEEAELYIDNNKDTIESCGMWSIKQHPDIPTETKLEYKSIQVGQIITTLDLKLPVNIQYENLSPDIKDLFKLTVDEFQSILSQLNVDIDNNNITKLNTPEKAAAFIFLTLDKLKAKTINGYKQTYLDVLRDRNNTEMIEDIINKIHEAEAVSYIVQQKGFTTKGGKTSYVLKQLKNHGTDYTENLTKQLYQESFDMYNLTDLIEYFKYHFGVQIEGKTDYELKKFSKEHKLGIESNLDSIHGFVYNGVIYINTTNAKRADIVHELSHILLGLIKVQNVEAYNNIINSYTQNKELEDEFNKRFNTNKSLYMHYAEEDIIEETVADLIAEQMSEVLKNELTKSSDNPIIQEFQNIFKIADVFMNNEQDNGLGFTNYFKTLLNTSSNALQRKMKITDFISKKIKEGQIIKECN